MLKDIQCEARTLNRIKYAVPSFRCRRQARCIVYDHYQSRLIAACQPHGSRLLAIYIKRMIQEKESESA
jgi:hypothetical protein